MKIACFLFALISMCSCVQSRFQLSAATSQHWSGGQPGHYGTNYVMEFVYAKKDSVIIDSIYINNTVYSVMNSTNNSNTAFWYKLNKDKKSVIRLMVNESVVENNDPVLEQVVEEKKVQVPMKIEGAALVILHRNNKKEKALIKSFVNLPSINYP